MPFFTQGATRFHYQESGQGEAIIALHGLAQHSAYWMDTGVADALSKDYRVIALDMRGHGLTETQGEPKQYNITTLVEDVNDLAAHLGLTSFHLMGHSTGGMVASRYAMEYGHGPQNPLRSLLLLNTSPSTQFSNLPETANKMAINVLASSFETFSWPLIVQGLKLNPGPLFAGVANAPNREDLYAQALTLMQGSNSKSVGAFIREFYDDANPYTERLAKIQCPTLIITAELDHIFTKTSVTLAKYIPNNRVSHHPSCGHMTALEDPRWLSEQILEFLNWLTKTES